MAQPLLINLKEVGFFMSTNKLRKITEGHLLTKELKRLRKDNTKVFAWKLVNEEKIIYPCVILSIDFSSKIISIRPIEEVSDEFYAEYRAKKYLRLFFPNGNTLFESSISKYSLNESIIMKLPDFLAKLDRRKNTRLIVNENSSVKLFFYKSNSSNNLNVRVIPFEKFCYDISVGGLSFIASKSEKNFFSVGDEIDNIMIFFENSKLELCGKVVNFLAIKPNESNDLAYDGLKVCMEFTDISQQDREKLDVFIFKHTAVGNY